MKNKKLVAKALSFILVGTLLAGSTLTAFAEDRPAEVTGVQWIDNQVKTDMNEAEAAAAATQKAAESAQAAAAQAQAAADALTVTKDKDGNTVDQLIDAAEKVTTDIAVPAGSVEPTTGETLSKNETVAEAVVQPAVQIAESANAYVDQQKVAIEVSANEAAVAVSANATKVAIEAVSANAAKVEADKALAAAQNTKDYNTAQAAANQANAAYAQAAQAAANADTFYQQTLKMLADAQAEFDAAVKDAQSDIDGYQTKLDAAVAKAQAALDDAQIAVTKAQDAYNLALKNKEDAEKLVEKAEKAAAEAKKQSGVVSENSAAIDAKVKAPVENDIAAAKTTVSANAALLASAQDAQTKINAAQDAVIAKNAADKLAAQNAIPAVQKQIDSYNAAVDTINDLEYKGFLAIYSDIEYANLVLKKGKNGWIGLHKISQSDINNANTTVNTYNSATKTKSSINITALDLQKATLNNTITTAEKNILAAGSEKTKAANTVTTAQNTLTQSQAQEKAVEDYLATFNYTDTKAVVYTDKTKEKQYKKLLSDMMGASGAYNDITNDVNSYEWATNDVDFWNFFEKEGVETSIEFKYHEWKTNDGVYIIIQNEKKNLAALILVKGDKAYFLGKEQGELASYTAAFDKVASAQAAEKAALAAAQAAKAAQVVTDAQARLTAAQKALDEAQARLDAAKIKKLDVTFAKLAVEKAGLAVDAASVSLKDAKADQTVAYADAQEAQRIATSLIPATTTTTTTTTTTAAPAVVVAPVTTGIAAATAPAVTPAVAGATRVKTKKVKATPVVEEKTITDEKAPTTATVKDATDTKKVEEPTTVIDDQAAPLTDSVVKTSFNWLWLLLIALVVAVASFAGYKVYKKKTMKIDTK